MTENTSDFYLKPGRIDLIKHRWVYLGISLLFLIPGVYFIIMSMITYPTHAPIRLGIDFTGGTILEYGFTHKITQKDIQPIRQILDNMGYTGSVIQLQEPTRANLGEAAKEQASALSVTTSPPAAPTAPPASSHSQQPPSQQTAVKSVSTPPARQEISMNTLASVVSMRTKQLKNQDGTVLQQRLQQRFGSLVLLQKNSIGPTLASELFTNALIALLLAYLLIIGYLTFRFQFDYAICAIVALVHDTLFVIGMFSMLGYLFHTEVDSLFVTAILTVVGFSVHDTIVVFDRLRENTKRLYTKKVSFGQIANISINQTLARSVNTSFTALLTLLALFFLGGETTHDFALALIFGIATGTFSSIFIASLCLAWWREGKGKASGISAVAAG